QWAGPDALELLATLIRSATTIPFRVVGAYRDTEVQPQDPLAALLADLAHAGLAAQRTLGRLTLEETGQLLDHLLTGVEDIDRVLRHRALHRSGGVPFFAVSCAQGLRLSGQEDDREDAVPWDVAQSVRQRLAALPNAAREM